MAEKEVFLVRLKPRPAKPRKGQVKTPSRYMYGGVRFEENKGWYRITDAAFAAELEELTHNDREDGVRIFDVCTPKEAAAIQAKERRNKVRREVEDAEVQTVSPQTRRARGRSSAVTMDDVQPESDPDAELRRRVRDITTPKPKPEMIDGADLDDEGDEADEGDGELGRLDGDEIDQELDDADDLLDGTREPEAPKVRQAESAQPKTRTRKGGQDAPAKGKGKSAKKS